MSRSKLIRDEGVGDGVGVRGADNVGGRMAWSGGFGDGVGATGAWPEGVGDAGGDRVGDEDGGVGVRGAWAEEFGCGVESKDADGDRDGVGVRGADDDGRGVRGADGGVGVGGADGDGGVGVRSVWAVSGNLTSSNFTVTGPGREYATRAMSKNMLIALRMGAYSVKFFIHIRLRCAPYSPSSRGDHSPSSVCVSYVLIRIVTRAVV